jgi:hypothetical protein
VVNDKAAATYHPGEEPKAQHQDDELPPLSVLSDMLKDVIDVLNGVDELVIEHRRAAGDDHHQLERLQVVSARVGQAWSAVVSARRALRS